MANILLNSNYNTWLVDQNKAYVGAFNQSDKLNFRFNADMSNSFNGCSKLNFNIEFYKNMFENVTNMSSTFRNCLNLNTNLYVPAGVTDLSYAYDNCNNIRGQAVCSDLVTNMRNAYAYCRKITNYPVCGNNVIDFSGAYQLCNQLNKSPVCGPNVTNMSNTYNQCIYMRGNPVCGPKVTNMACAYYYCNKLTGSPVCGDNVTDMNATYYECNTLTGNPVCGNNVINMARTYMNCQNLTGNPVCGDKVTAPMDQTYNNCIKLTGTAACGPLVKNMYCTYQNCFNLNTAVCGPNVTDMWMTYYNCNNLTTPVCGENVTFFYGTYSGCTNLTSVVCGNNVQNFCSCYANCTNLTCSPVVGPNVYYMAYTYRNCQNLTGNPISGPNTINMMQAYQNCKKIGGTPNISYRVQDLQSTFDNTNVEVAVIPRCVIYASSAYRNCYNLKSIANSFNCGLQGATAMFCGCNNLPTNLNIWLPPNLQQMAGMFGGSNSSQLVNTAGNFYFYATYQSDWSKGINTFFNNVNNSIVRNVFLDSNSSIYNDWINVGTWTRNEQLGCMTWLNYRIYPIGNMYYSFNSWVFFNKNVYNNNIWEFNYARGSVETWCFRDVCNVNVMHDSNVELALGGNRPCGINCTYNNNNELIELYAVLPDEQSCDYFYVEPADGVASTDFTFTVTGTMDNKLAYSKDKSSWTTYENGTAITINSGEKLYFKSLSTTALNSNSNYIRGEATNNYKIGGRVSSLILTQPLVYSYKNYSSSFALARLFQESTKLVDASKLICDLAGFSMYYAMFQNCINLVHPCKIITRDLDEKIFIYMFKGCTSLTSTPRLKALYASTSSCESMFEGCTSLVKIHIPTIVNTTTKSYCAMFKNCSSLQIYNTSGEGHTNPISIVGKSDYQALENMFLGTTGDYATSGTPTTGSIIYTQNIQVNEESDTYQFDGWYDGDGNLVSTANPYPFTVSSDITLEARASLKS